MKNLIIMVALCFAALSIQAQTYDYYQTGIYGQQVKTTTVQPSYYNNLQTDIYQYGQYGQQVQTGSLQQDYWDNTKIDVYSIYRPI